MGAGADEVMRHPTGSTESISEMRARIEQTRGEMTETVNAIQRRLAPENMKYQARMAVRDATIGRAEEMAHNARITAEGAGYTMFETIKHNPVPAAIAALGLGWLMMESRSMEGRRGMTRGRTSYTGRGHRDYGYYDARDLESEAQSYYPREGGMEKVTGGMQERAGEMRSEVEDIGRRAQYAAGEAADEMGRMAHEASSRMGEMTEEARHRMEDFGEQAEYQMRRTSSWLEHTMHERPLMMGAIALAAGAAIGIAVPESRREDELMGGARESLMHRTQDAADQAMHSAQRVVEEAGSAMKKEMEDQDLEDRVRHAAEDTAHAAKKVVDEGQRAADEEARRQGMRPD